MKIITKHSQSENGYLIKFDNMDGSPSALEIDKPQKGTMVSVRNIHKSVKSVQATYKKFRENHYENAII
jgi:hypothetical protein